MDFSVLGRMRAQNPRIHYICNHVTSLDCANLLLAAGASPIMAEEPEEAAEITAGCGGLAVNLGTPNRQKARACRISAETANRTGKPAVLDPVGVGASAFRIRLAGELLAAAHFAAIRCNQAELWTLCREVTFAGVDSSPMGSLEEVIRHAERLSQKTGAALLVTGETDVIHWQGRTLLVRNGHPMMSRLTGSGCMLTGLLAALLAASPQNPLECCAAASAVMGLAGEMAFARMGPRDGMGSYKTYLFDAVTNLTEDDLKGGTRYEIR